MNDKFEKAYALAAEVKKLERLEQELRESRETILAKIKNENGYKIYTNYKKWKGTQLSLANKLLPICNCYPAFEEDEEIAELVEFFIERKIYKFAITGCSNQLRIIEAFINAGYKIEKLVRVRTCFLQDYRVFSEPAIELKLKQSKKSL